MSTADDQWLLPEGVEEVLPPRAIQLESIRRELLDLFRTWGYDLVIPPFLEYLDSLLIGTGKDLDLQTFKIIDQLSGRLLGIRADMTPQVARIDAHHLRDHAPVRLCYLGTVLRSLSDGLAASRSPVQVGAELYGHAGIESDCEVLCLLLQAIHVAGLRDVHLDLGHVGIFRGLAEQAGLSPGDEASLHAALQRKARPEIEMLLQASRAPNEVARMILALVDLNGGEEVLANARTLFRDARDDVGEAVGALERIADELHGRVANVALHFDLAELRGYAYHTGVVYAVFVPGHGQEIARGGRYDDIGKVFGAARPATGFSMDLKLLVDLSCPAPGLEVGDCILAPWSQDADLLETVAALRNGGQRVLFDLPGQPPAAEPRRFNRVLERVDGDWVVVEV